MRQTDQWLSSAGIEGLTTKVTELLFILIVMCGIKESSAKVGVGTGL